MTKRTSHQIMLGPLSAEEAMKAARKQHDAGKGKRAKESGCPRLAPVIQVFFSKQGKPDFVRGPDRKPNAKGKRALAGGGRIKEQKNGVRVIVNRKGHIKQHIGGGIRDSRGRFTSKTQSLAVVRKRIDGFFGEKHTPTEKQLAAAWKAYKGNAELKGWSVPDIDPKKL